MRRVTIESPYAGDVEANTSYARRCMLDSLNRGEAPFVSHLLYTQALDDENPDQRAYGMSAGFEYMVVADSVVVYTDHGISGGMIKGIKRAMKLGKDLEFRKIGK